MKTRPSDYLNTVQLLNQLVEEAAELASAASKMMRIIDGANPTPVTPEAGWMQRLEERDNNETAL